MSQKYIVQRQVDSGDIQNVASSALANISVSDFGPDSMFKKYDLQRVQSLIEKLEDLDSLWA